MFSETHAAVDRLCMGREGRGAALSSLHLVRCLRLQWLCLRWPDNVRALALNWWDSIDCVRRRPGPVYTWFQLFTFHWLCLKTTWNNIFLVGTDEIPLTVCLRRRIGYKHIPILNKSDSSDCVSEDDFCQLKIRFHRQCSASAWWSNQFSLSLPALFVCGTLISSSPWYNRTGWLGVKHQLTYLLISSFLCQHCLCVTPISSHLCQHCLYVTPISSHLCQHCLCVTPISSFLCQHCLCVVLSSLLAFVKTACVWFSHQFLCQDCLQPTDQIDIFVCSPTHALSMSVVVLRQWITTGS